MKNKIVQAPKFLSTRKTATAWAKKNTDSSPDKYSEPYEHDLFNDRVDVYVFSCQDAFERWNYNKEPITIFRAIVTKMKNGAPYINIDSLGKAWSIKRKGARPQNRKWLPEWAGEEVTALIQGSVSPIDVDWEYGFTSFLEYGEDQFEVSVNKHVPITVTHINDEKLPDPIIGNSGDAQEEWTGKNPLDDNDLFQMKRAEEARQWLKSPQREKERLADIAAQAAADVKAGHSSKCGLMKCHPECPSLKKKKNPPVEYTPPEEHLVARENPVKNFSDAFGVPYEAHLAPVWPRQRKKHTPIIRSSAQIAEYMSGLIDVPQEQFMIVLLDGKYAVIGVVLISKGTINEAAVHPREVFAAAISGRAVAIIGIHNHPSGQTVPSDADFALTNKLVEAGNIIGIPLIDHLVLGKSDEGSVKFSSLQQMGMIPK